MKILAISGSLRKNSYNTALLRHIINHAPKECEIELVQLHDIPFYNGDVEQNHGIPTAVQAIQNKIVATDGILISTPEYNHSIPGVIKNTIDWLARPTDQVPRIFGGKPIAIIGASPSLLGTAFSQMAWLPIMRYLNLRPYFKMQIYVSEAHKKFDDQGKLTDKMTQDLLEKFMQGYIDFIKQ